MRVESRGRSTLAIAAALCLSSTLLPAVAFAQRGASFVQQEAPVEVPSGGFPGVFDTHLTPAGGFVLELPTGTLDYGVTPNLTVGANLGVMLLGSANMPAGVLKARYRVYSSRRVSAVGTVYVGRLALPGALGMAVDMAAAVGSVTLHYSSRRALTFTSLGFFLRISDSRDYDEIELRSTSSIWLAGGGLTYEHFFLRWFGVKVTGVLLPVAIGTVDTDQLSGRNSLNPLDFGVFERTYVHGWLVFMPGKWELSAGVMGVVKSVEPMLTAARRW
ncbi:MAG: hypothetical protein V2A73_10775 [Pseudomonadota bacterium]